MRWCCWKYAPKTDEVEDEDDQFFECQLEVVYEDNVDCSQEICDVEGGSLAAAIAAIHPALLPSDLNPLTTGTWHDNESAPNTNEFLSRMLLGYVVRKLLMSAQATYKVEVRRGSYHTAVSLAGGLIKFERELKLGEEFTDTETNPGTKSSIVGSVGVRPNTAEETTKTTKGSKSFTLFSVAVVFVDSDGLVTRRLTTTLSGDGKAPLVMENLWTRQERATTSELAYMAALQDATAVIIEKSGSQS